MKNKIDILVACGRNSEGYVKHLVDSIDKTASGRNTLRFLLGINDLQVSKDKLESISSQNEISVLNCISPGTSSNGHGECLDLLSNHIDSEYTVVVDCDVAFLCKDWDEILISELEKNENIAAIGNEYDGKKYMNFPNVVMCMVKSEILKSCDISWKPSNDRTHVITEETSTIFGRSVGDTIDLDTGWQLCYKLKKAGYTGIALPLRRKSAGDECIFLREGVRGEEHILGNRVICTHIGRSFTRNFYKDPIVIKWRNLVKEWNG